MDFSKFFQTPAVFKADDFQSATPGVKAMFFAGPGYNGKETRVFAWYSLPEGASAEAKVPGIVLVHGGGGTAFAPWVKIWTDRGYAAIAIDMFGGLPEKDGALKCRDSVRFEYSGPNRENIFADVDLPAEEQWPCHAAAAIISAGSFLASLPEVDSSKIGLTGISWGGYASALAAGYDNRFRFVMPVYGCGGFETLKLVPEDTPARQLKKFIALWDPDNTLSQANMPMLWINGACDAAFDVRNWNNSTKQALRSYRSLRPSMTHGHTPALNLPELFAFADAAIKGHPFPGFTKTAYNEETNQIGGKWNSDVKIVRAEIAWTRAYGCWNDCVFRTEQAKLNQENHTVVGDLPSDWSAAYLMLFDEAGMIYSSEVYFNE